MSLSRAPRGSPTSSAGSGGSPTTPTAEGVSKTYGTIIKSQNDSREYKGLLLSNNLKVLLVSDPTTDKAAAALDVNVGYLSDPEELPGLAHFCEHMLFMGTEKYPQENKYSKYLSEHGGSSNAGTSSDHTTYYFDVLPAHLADALDIFAQFFIKPLFTESGTERELNAVNSEHEKNMAGDMWRLDQLNKSTAHPTHAYHKFGTGNKETLDIIPKAKGINVRSELLNFYKTWYSSNIMTLIVLGKESLEELETMVVPLFSQIEDKSVTSPTWPEHPFPPELRRRKAYCVPIKDLRSLSVEFPLPDTKEYYKSGPGHYLSHLLGHEGPGSLLSALKGKNWCNSLVGGLKHGARGFGFFNVQVDLTEIGMEHVDDIVHMVFQYIDMVRKETPQRWIWEEHKDLMAMEFRFKDVTEPMNFASGHVHLLQDYPMEDVLDAYYILTEWRPDLIEHILTFLVPENVRIAVVSKSFEDICTQVEPWYGTKYLEEIIADLQIQIWGSVEPNPSFHLPPANEFIPSRLDLYPLEDTSTAPTIIKDTNLLRIWHKQDNDFGLPKAFMTFSFVSPLAYSDPVNCNLNSMWVSLIRDNLQQYSYAAELAGLKWNVHNNKFGIDLVIEGYDDKQHVLLEKVVEKMVDFKADRDRFEIIKENLKRTLKNFEAEQPYQHAVYQLATCLSEAVWTRPQLMDAVEDLTLEQFHDFTSKMIRKVHIEGLIFGNIVKERALQMIDIIENKLPKDGTPLLAQQLLLYREIELEKGASYLREATNSVHKSSCTSVYFPCGVQSPRNNVSLELLAHIMAEPCFNVLRTKEQLGYIVFTGVRRSHGVQGLRVLVQSDRHPEFLETRIEAFLEYIEEYLENMSEEEYNKFSSSLAAHKLEKPKRIMIKAALMWNEITGQMYNFDRPRVEVDQLNTLTKDDIVQLYKKRISSKSDERQKLAVHILSTLCEEQRDDTKLETEAVKITDLIEFKSRRRLYPHPTPFIHIPRKGAQCKL